ncbi:phosphosulfolactate synthase [Cohnella nanjingensis]|uniref:Phosphosulfolactate synthase n=1 Tax=Cohnella nanjingensis TaxID=1387779 RepID=A0A7X0VJ68_9BACL|nr:phosphosulfolactate synthase [Cohnella nanjingensis]MBB6675248.1 phosphosulfolactate synthase [Cohnella nanjingensis]
MDIQTETKWHPLLSDPSDSRRPKPRETGRTMIMDKGLGPNAFQDLLSTSGPYIDLIKFGFGTSPLYPIPMLKAKIASAKAHGIGAFPGGTLLEAAVRLDVTDAFFRSALELGFDAIEVSDGTIDLDRQTRDALVREAGEYGFRVFTEYGKKLTGSRISLDDLCLTAERDLQCGAEAVTIEARESGVGVGLFDEDGKCREEELQQIVRRFPDADRLMWEAPQKEQQALLLRTLGPDVNLGNVSPQDAFSLETLRRGLRSDTFALHRMIAHYEI